MIRIHENALRGRTRTGWLDSYHSIFFGQVSDTTHSGFVSVPLTCATRTFEVTSPMNKQMKGDLA